MDIEKFHVQGHLLEEPHIETIIRFTVFVVACHECFDFVNAPYYGPKLTNNIPTHTTISVSASPAHQHGREIAHSHTQRDATLQVSWTSITQRSQPVRNQPQQHL